MTTENTPHPLGNVDAVGRRTAIKKAAVAAATAGVVWNAPTIKGLSLRPVYAAASSHTGDDCVDDVNGVLRIADFRDIAFNTFTLQIQNDTGNSVDGQAIVTNRPYDEIPNLNLPMGTTHVVLPASNGTGFDHVFTFTISGFGGVTFTGGLTDPSGDGDNNAVDLLICT